jgi:hypothetical protein
MRRALPTYTLAAVLFISAVALGAKAKDDPPPPPPPPPPSDAAPPPPPPPSDDSSSSGDGPSGSTFRSTDALLDASKGKHRPMMLSFFLGVAYPYYVSWGVPIGARFNLPIVHDGFVPQINDSFDIEFGIDVVIAPGAYLYTPIYFVPRVGPRYTVYLLPKLAVYAKPELGIAIWPTSGCTGCQVIWPHFEFTVGLAYKITDAFYLRAEVSSYAIRGGLGLAF